MEYQVSNKIKSFTDLETWRVAHDLVIKIYKGTSGFPDEERFGLTSQIRRSAVSVTSNIAEGFSRSTARDKSHFYRIALGSLTELQSQMLIARDLVYLDKDKFDELAGLAVDSHKLLNGLIKAVSNGKGVHD